MTANSEYTTRERRDALRYTWEFSAGMLLFVFAFALLPLLWPTDPGTWPRLLRALIPAIPLVWVVVSVWRHFRRMDEMQRAAFARSLSFGFAVAMLTTVVVGMIRGGGFEVPFSEWIVFISGMTAWGLSLPVNLSRSNG